MWPSDASVCRPCGKAACHCCCGVVQGGAGSCTCAGGRLAVSQLLTPRASLLPCPALPLPLAPAGRRSRYTYCAQFADNKDGVPTFNGITKYDLLAAGSGGGSGGGSAAAPAGATALAGAVLHGGRRCGGEAFFVPKASGACRLCCC